MATILIAEDEPHIIRVMSLWLARNGHKVIESRDGVEALAAFDAAPPDLVISDMNMPRMTGLELIRTLREERRTTVPILMFSSRTDQGCLSRQAAEYNVVLYPKPFTPSRLTGEIERMLADAAPATS
jgi:CheY-like chemotaxis protein